MSKHVEYDKKYCDKCEEVMMHELVGKSRWSIWDLGRKKYFKCMTCGTIHITDTFYRETYAN